MNAATDAGTVFDEMTETLFAAAQVVLFTAFRISKTDKIITPMDLAYTSAMTAPKTSAIQHGDISSTRQQPLSVARSK